MKKMLPVAVVTAVLLISAAWSQTISSGTKVTVRVNESLSSDQVKAGDRFTGVLTEPIVSSNGQTLFPRNSDVEGQVIRVVDSGRLTRPGELELKLTSVRSGNTSAALNTEPWIIKGASHTKSNATKIGGGAAAGAIIGAIAGGGKGAAIGAGVGAAAGTGVAVATGKKPATIESEAILAFTTNAATSTNMSSSRGARSRQDGAYRDSNNNNPNSSDGYNSTPGNAAMGNGNGDYRVFSARDRDEITHCYTGGRSGLPPGLAKKDRLPPGLERQLQKNGKLPPGLQKRVQPLSSNCQARLPRLPVDWQRVILGDRVMVLDPAQTIVDIFRMSLNR